MPSTPKRALLGGTALSLALVGGLAPAFAQNTLALEEIVVTAQRRESTLLDAPIAVSAFDANEIERRQSFNVVDIVNNVPNLVGNNNIGQGTATTVFLRGVGTTEAKSGDIDLVSAALNFETADEMLSFGISCRNCIDDEYISQSLDFRGLGFITVYPGEPATWLFTVKTRL
jgi:outer membrane receptor protein involved in Fe transport